MAGELVAGAFLSSFFTFIFDRLSSPEVVNWIRGKKPDQKLLGRLKKTLQDAHALLDDAEQRQIKEKAVKDWLVSLEDAAYAADDLLDEVSTKAATKKDPGNIFSRFLNLQDGEMVSRMEGITQTLESIVSQNEILGLKQIPKEDFSWRVTSSVVDISDIYGRDEDKEAIIKILLDDTSDAKVSVIPIVGMGGVGKTTIAQLVYNDDKLKEKFDFKVWVCVGENFDVLKMTKTILAKTSSSCNTDDFDSIQCELKNELTGKRFLIVLDDMWNDNYDDWKKFQTPFQNGSKGSTILVTTRNDNVASRVQTIGSYYNLNLLSNEHCWFVFAKHASLSPRYRDYSSLEKVGRKIVEKCKGLPLAAQTLGGLLRTKDDVRDWKNILNSEIWENESRILPALRISYHYLPSYSKRCFVFCSLYPKDYEFDRDELVLLWMAGDLLERPESGTLEKSGYKCFNDLASRSFFQPSNINENLFVMHDLMHDLAIFCASKFYFRASEFGTTTHVDLKARHLSYDVPKNDLFSKFLETFGSFKHARTLLQTSFAVSGKFPKEIASSIPLLLSQLKCLRVLCFKGIPLDSMPDSIGELIHLRYLDLSKALIETLPESLSNLYNLQTLKLRDCEKLKMLPSRMQDLVNLRHLDIRGTCLKEIPEGMNKLKDLRFLSDYFVGHNVNGIREFGELTNLHGSLVIHQLENVSNSGEASDARMIHKKHIDDLTFIWSPSSSCDVNLQTEKDIFKELKPCTEVKEITIRRYRGEVFPDWLGQSSYHRMTVLTLRGCKNCCNLPSLGQLPHLKHLEIYFFDKLTSIGDELFYKNDHETPFPSLETLDLHCLPMWQVWHWSQFDAAFSQLKRLSIMHCPMLAGSLPNHLPALEKLYIVGSGQLDCSLPSTPNILKLNILGAREVRFQELTSLRSLTITNCSSAISFPGASMPASLQDLQIRDCKKLEFPMQQQRQQDSLHRLAIDDSCDSLISFPLAAFPNLTELGIQSCANLKCFEGSQSKDAAPLPPSLDLAIRFCPSFESLLSQSSRNNNAALPSLLTLRIQGCDSFASFSTLGKAAPQLELLDIRTCPEVEIDSFDEEGGDGSLPATLRYLHVYGCEKLVRCLTSSTVLHSCRSLTTLEIGGACDSVKSFPREGCLPASLDTLILKWFQSLETLDCKGLLHLTSLRELIIVHCPKLENIVGERMPASLKELRIVGCPLLGERYRAEDPQICSKISHIPDIDIDIDTDTDIDIGAHSDTASSSDPDADADADTDADADPDADADADADADGDTDPDADADADGDTDTDADADADTDKDADTDTDADTDPEERPGKRLCM